MRAYGAVLFKAPSTDSNGSSTVFQSLALHKNYLAVVVSNFKMSLWAPVEIIREIRQQGTIQMLPVFPDLVELCQHVALVRRVQTTPIERRWIGIDVFRHAAKS